jgi:hypothetical protein
MQRENSEVKNTMSHRMDANISEGMEDQPKGIENYSFELFML